MNWRLLPKAQADSARIDEEWGSLRWLAGKAVSDTEGLTLGRVTIKPKQSNPRHSHPNCDEVLYLLSGKLRHSIGDESVVLESGDTLIVAGGLAHNALNIGDEDADMIVAYTSGDRQFRREV